MLCSATLFDVEEEPWSGAVELGSPETWLMTRPL